MWKSRAVQWISATVFAVLAVGLSLSDRAPQLFKQFRTAAVGLWRTGEQALAIDVLNRSDIPWAADEIGHLVLWGTGMVIIGFGFRGRVPAEVLAAGLFLSSIAMELLQRVATNGRAMEFTDISANGIGILLGLVVVVATAPRRGRRSA